MLKTRVMPTLLYKDFTLVKGVGFDSWRRVGSAMQAVKVYNMREVDELIFLDITATNDMRGPDLKIVDEIADECFMPLTVGGGVKDIEDVRRLLEVGADKVAINSMAFDSPELVREASRKFGSQCIVVSIDVIRDNSNKHKVCTNSGKKIRDSDPVKFAQTAEEMGAGEILLTSVDRDGTFKGYDIELVKNVTKVVSIPVIASGGAGKCEDAYTVLKEGGAQAVACASIFHFTEITPLMVKDHLRQKGIPIRS